MKKISFACVLVLVVAVGAAIAQQFTVDIAGDAVKDFVTEIDLSPGQQITLDLYLQSSGGPQDVGGIWIDWYPTDLISYVSAGRALTDGSEGLIGPWDPAAGVLVNEPGGPGTVMYVVGNLGSATPDGDGDLIIGRLTLECTGEGDVGVSVSCIPGPGGCFSPCCYWLPPTTLTIHQIYIDTDNDEVQDYLDNCPLIPNGPDLGTCIAGASYKIGRPCMSDVECGTGGFCSMNQEDTNEDGIGDACYLCECDFDCNGAVDANDITSFLADFGRSEFNDPCTTGNPCNGDVDCNGAVDADDVTKFLEDFGRNEFNDPCPACEVGNWCVYP